jgi:nucleoside-diphosphate-sugar epimerase
VLTSPEEIEMWGDGKQTRSFTFIDDCVEGVLRITKSDFKEVRRRRAEPTAERSDTRVACVRWQCGCC